MEQNNNFKNKARIMEIYAKAKQYGIDSFPDVQLALLRAGINSFSKNNIASAEKVVSSWIQKITPYINTWPTPLPWQNQKRQYLVGNIKGPFTENPFFLNDIICSRGVIVSGNMGSWKTNLISGLIPQIMKTKNSIVIIDQKHDYNYLLRHYPGQVAVIRVLEKDKRNFASPDPGVSWNAHIKGFLESLSLYFWAETPVLSLLLEAYNSFFKDNGRIPSHREIFQYIRAARISGKLVIIRRDIFETAQSRCYELLSNFGSVIEGVQEGYSLEFLLSTYRIVVFDVSSLHERIRGMYASQIAHGLLLLQRQRQQRVSNEIGEGFLYVIFEESTNLFNKRLTMHYKYSTILEEVILQGRENKLCMFFVTQTPSQVFPAILNVSTHIVFYLKSKEDREIIAAAMGRADRGLTLSTLADRECLISTPVFPSNFVVKTDFPIITDKNMTIAEIDSIMDPQISKWPYKKVPQAQPASIPVSPVMSPLLEQFLKSIALNPFDNLIKHKQRVGIKSSATADQTVHNLETNFGMIKKHSTIGGIIFELLNPGINYAIKELKISLPVLAGKGGFKSQFYSFIVKSYFDRQNANAIIEGSVGGIGLGRKQVDVLAIMPDNKRIGIEITLSFTNIEENAVKDLAPYGVDTVIFAVENRKALALVKKIIKNSEKVFDKSKVEFELLSKYF